MDPHYYRLLLLLLYIYIYFLLCASDLLEAHLRDWKEWVREKVQFVFSHPDQPQYLAKAAFVCDSGTHRSDASATIVQACLERDGLAGFVPKHCSSGMWKQRRLCWSCWQCRMDDPSKAAVFDLAYAKWRQF